MKCAIINFPGTNRENDMAMAIHTATGAVPEMVWHKDTDLGNPDLIVLPGGFSHGDYLRCGAMAAHSPIMREVLRLAGKGTRILGVCNGFQILLETRLLEGALLRNAGLRFICKNTWLRAESFDNPFTAGLEPGHLLHVPVAHGEGNYFATPDTVSRLEDDDLIAFRYCNDNGDIDAGANPNGSAANIAGILNSEKTILGMMPHPENATQDWQGNTGGTALFESIVSSFA